MFAVVKTALVGLVVLLLVMGAAGPVLADPDNDPNVNACYGQWIAHYATTFEGLAHVPAAVWNGFVGGVEGARAAAQSKECPLWPEVPAND